MVQFWRHKSWQLAGMVTLCVTLATLGLFMLDALERGRLPTPEQRIPTALYSRPVPWGREAPARLPINLGTVDGNAMELREPVPLEEVPEELVNAVLAIEDQRFFHHSGLEIRRIIAAFIANLKAGEITQGGSTISQQLAKNLFLSPSRSPIRKLREAVLATVLESRYDKPTLLRSYLNEIYLGQGKTGAIHGVGAAARYYFGKPVPELSLAEAALLAGMIQAPNRYAPDRNPEAARARRDLVLAQMLDQRRIEPEEAELARAKPVPQKVFPPDGYSSRWFRDFAARYLPGDLPARGMALHTTLDLTLQEMAERAVRKTLARLDLDGEQAALVALDPRTGEVLAMVGGTSYETSQFNRATSALRQPGSAFKPIVAATALEPPPGGLPAYTLASLLDDAPLFLPTSNGPWHPANYDGRYRGLVTLRRATEQSLNVPFARLGLVLGPSRIVEMAQRLGIGSPLRAVPSLALGTSEVTLLELARAYGVFASNGRLAATQIFYRPAAYGETVEPYQPEVRDVLDPRVAYLVTSTLEGVVMRGTARALQSSRFGGIAGKTGTSSDWRDAWFIAYSPALVVGAWVGYDDGRSLHLTGARAALPIVEDFLSRVAPYLPNQPFVEPAGIVETLVQVNREWPWECGRRELFLAGTEPPRPVRPCFDLDLPGF